MKLFNCLHLQLVLVFIASSLSATQVTPPTSGPPVVPGINDGPVPLATVQKVEVLADGNIAVTGWFESELPAAYTGLLPPPSEAGASEFVAVFNADRSLRSIQPATGIQPRTRNGNSLLRAPSAVLQGGSYYSMVNPQHASFGSGSGVPQSVWYRGEITRHTEDGSVLWNLVFPSVDGLNGTFDTLRPVPGGVIVGGNYQGQANFDGTVLSWDGSSGSLSNGFFGLLNINGAWEWVQQISTDSNVRVKGAFPNASGNLLVLAAYGTHLPTEDPLLLQAGLPDGRQLSGQSEAFRGYFVSEFTLSGEHVGTADLTDFDIFNAFYREGPVQDASGSLILANRSDVIRIQGYDQIEVIASDLPLRSLMGVEPELAAVWNAVESEYYIQSVWPASNGDYVVFGRAGDFVFNDANPVTGPNSGAPFFFAHLDGSGNLISSIIHRNFFRGMATVDDLGNFYFSNSLSLWNQGASLEGEFANGTLGALDTSAVLLRQRGPFSGLASIDGWRMDPVFGWVHSDGNSGWWYSLADGAWIYPDAGSSSRSLWMYHAEAGWVFTRSELFSWAFSVNAGDWISLR